MSRLRDLPLTHALFGLAVGLGSVVQIEPAPCDLLMVAVGALLLWRRDTPLPPGLAPPAALVGLFLLFSLLAAAVSADPGHAGAYFGITSYLVLSTFVVAVLVAQDAPGTLALLWRMYLTAALFASALGVLGFYHLVPGYEALLRYDRARALFKDANVYGPFLVPVLLYCLLRAYRDGGRRRWAWGAAAAALFFGLLLSFSRGAWGNFALSLGALLVLAWRRASSRPQRRRLLGVSVALALLLGSAAAFAFHSQAFTRMFEERAKLVQYYDTGARSRLYYQTLTLRQAFTHPLGIGPYQIQAQFGNATHNNYLKLLAENGWIAALAYLALLLLTLRRGLAATRRAGPLQPHALVTVAAFLGLIAEGFLVDTLHWRHLYLVMGMIWGIALAQRGPTPADDG